MDRPEPIPPGPDQESVWDYPRPPRVLPFKGQLEVIFGERTIAISLSGLRVVETSHPPAYYFPPDGVVHDYLIPSGRTSFCEYKGEATFFHVVVRSKRAPDAAWAYRDPSPGFERLKDHVAYYPGLMEACLVNGEMASPQPGGFYGGWITSTVVGPFKGVPGSQGW